MLFMVMTGCASQPTTLPIRIALLAPFESRYRAVGYDALYAARLALSESGVQNVEILAVDDGELPYLTADRAEALAGDPNVFAAIALGYPAVDANTQVALADIPTIIVGDWGAAPIGEQIFLLSLRTVGLPDDSFMFPDIRVLYPNYAYADFVSSAQPPDADFTRRYMEFNQIALTPTPLATLTYDAMRVLLEASRGKSTRAEIAASVSDIDYSGINGRIRFIAHAWFNPPQRSYSLLNGELVSP
jgi:hypothetical protein